MELIRCQRSSWKVLGVKTVKRGLVIVGWGLVGFLGEDFAKQFGLRGKGSWRSRWQAFRRKGKPGENTEAGRCPSVPGPVGCDAGSSVSGSWVEGLGRWER